MDLKEIEKLMKAMGQSHIKRIVLKREDYEIEIEKECAYAPAYASYTPQPTYAPPQMVPEFKPQSPLEANSKSEGKEKAGGIYVTSPMVGTYYSSPSPDDPPFVKPGDAISEDSVVCIIEAMKVMNEVKAGVKGVVAEVLIKNGEPVEFGTQILRVSAS